MKKRLILGTFLIFLIYIIIFNSVIVEYFLEQLKIINIAVFGLLMLVTYYLVGYPKNNRLINYNAGQTVIISFIIYYTIIYVMGLFFGFVANAYSLTMMNILKNILLMVIFYLFREMYRYMVIKQSNERKNIYLVTILFILLDIIMEINVYDLSTGFGIFEFICSSVIPSVSINILMSYIAYHFNLKNMLLFLMILKLPNYFIPLFPDLGNYLSSIILFILIFYLYYQLSVLLERYEKKISKKIQKKNNYSMAIVVTVILIFVGLVSGLFKYHLFAIVSNSMIPEFSRGDAVLVEKIRENELERLDVGDIVAFYSPDGRMIVHRIISITYADEVYSVKTKGDNNLSADPWVIKSDDIYGRVITSFKYIGLPSVELSELISR